jgi:serine/threonine protein kinase
MQFVDGTDADAALRAGTMTPERAVHIIGEVGKALDYAHQRGVVHRDIKPAAVEILNAIAAKIPH